MTDQREFRAQRKHPDVGTHLGWHIGDVRAWFVMLENGLYEGKDYCIEPSRTFLKPKSLDQPCMELPAYLSDTPNSGFPSTLY